MDYNTQEKLKELCLKARYSKEMDELTTFVSQHRGDFVNSPDVERAIDDFALLTGWIYDTLKEKAFKGEPKMTKRVRKSLGYVN